MGTVIGDRFEIIEPIGRGGFGIVYTVHDRLRQDTAVVKELAPPGCMRRDDGSLSLDGMGTEAAHRLRQRFLEEARLIAKLRVPGVLPVRAAFVDCGTAYFVTDHIPGAQTLEQVIEKRGRLPVADVMAVLFPLLETLETIHEKGYLHRDLKPSNILVGPGGDVYVLDFGAAREWHADAEGRHTVLFTPGYAPLEQLSERARRGPATDVYAVCATAYHLLTGEVPSNPAERVDGVPLRPIRAARPDVDPRLAEAIESGLEVRYGDRPQSVTELRDRIERAGDEGEAATLEEFDAQAVRLQRFRYERRQCPACSGVLEEPRPLRKGACPVCADGSIRKRSIHERLCPACASGTLRPRANRQPLVVCPLCRTGLFVARRKGFFGKETVYTCGECAAQFEGDADAMRLTDPGESKTKIAVGTEASMDDWRIESGRSETVHVCDGCNAQFDPLPDGRWRRVVPVGKGPREYFPEEWARVAAGLAPDAGNAVCTACEADFFLEEERITLLSYHEDPHGFGQENLGRLLTLDELRWVGVGKDSPNPGFVCASCHTEFDRDGQYLKLVRSPHRRMQRFGGEVMKLEDWHRIAQGLPRLDEETEFWERLAPLLVGAFHQGTLGVEGKPDVHWRGPAKRVDDGSSGTLLISDEEVSHGGMLRKWRVPLGAVVTWDADVDRLFMRVSGERDVLMFDVEPLELTVELESGRQRVELNAAHLAERMRRLAKPA